MAKGVFIIRRLSANPETDQYHDVGKEIGNRVDSIDYEGLAPTEYACQKLEYD
jgi:hypothetical protein